MVHLARLFIVRVYRMLPVRGTFMGARMTQGRGARRTVAELGEEVRKQVLGQDANVALDMIVENQPGRDGRLVLPPPAAVSLVRQSRTGA